jgi:hypothetical protein
MNAICEVMLITALVCSCIAILFCFFMLYRNKQVSRFVYLVLADINKYSKLDIEKGKDYAWRYAEYDKVNYDTMVNKFWIPLKVENFWQDVSFTKE